MFSSNKVNYKPLYCHWKIKTEIKFYQLFNKYHFNQIGPRPERDCISLFKGDVQRSHKGDVQRSHKGDVQRSHKEDVQRSHKGDVQRSHKGDVQRSRKGDVQRSHKGDVQRSHKEDVQRSHTQIFLIFISLQSDGVKPLINQVKKNKQSLIFIAN